MTVIDPAPYAKPYENRIFETKLSRALKEKGAVSKNTGRGKNMQVVKELSKNHVIVEESPVHSDRILINATTAANYREAYAFVRQRAIKERNVERLAEEMAKGRFIQGTQIFICVTPDLKMHLVNGNHTLEAIKRCGIPQILTVTTLEVKSLDEVCDIYACFDMQSRRSSVDTIAAYDLAPMPNSAKVYAAMAIILTDFQVEHKGAHSRVDVIGLMKQYHDVADNLHDAIKGGSEFKFLMRAGILAVALETVAYDCDKACAFWESVSKDDGLADGTPAKALLRYLRNSRAGGGKMVQIEHIKAAACAWNAYYRGEQIGFLRPNAMKSFYLLGTKWSGGVGAA